MGMTDDVLIETLKSLPAQQRAQVEDFVEFLAAKTKKRAAWDRLLAIAPALEAAGVEPMSEEEVAAEKFEFSCRGFGEDSNIAIRNSASSAALLTAGWTSDPPSSAPNATSAAAPPASVIRTLRLERRLEQIEDLSPGKYRCLGVPARRLSSNFLA